MNGSIIVKHRLRPNEVDFFDGMPRTVTKIIVPLDAKNLSIGGRSMFIGQTGWLDILRNEFGIDSRNASDVKVLEALNTLPSFDPFLLREWLARSNFMADPIYFRLSPSDIDRIEEFVFQEVSVLVSMALSGGAAHDTILRLVRKMLSERYDSELEPLRNTLRLGTADFHEGMFCWKGFLYYKSHVTALEKQITSTLASMRDVTSIRRMDPDLRRQIDLSRSRLGKAVVDTYNSAAKILDTYNLAYRRLTEQQNPMAFKVFLLDAPSTFVQLGEAVGQLGHIVEFWSFRLQESGVRGIAAEELADMLTEFEEGLGVGVAA